MKRASEYMHLHLLASRKNLWHKSQKQGNAGFVLVLLGFADTNMFVLVTQKCHVGAHAKISVRI